MGSEVDVMVMGERIKPGTRLATARVDDDAGTTQPGDAEHDAGPAADTPRAGDAAHRGVTGAGRS